jgi:predicted RNA-binding Zn ribbon-like protein
MDWHGSNNPTEKLNSYSDLIRWSLREGVLDKEAFNFLLRESKADPKRANLALEKARNLRELIYRIFSAIGHDLNPQSKDIDLINRTVSKAMSNLELNYQKGKDQFYWRWKKSSRSDFNQVLWPIAKSAADLLVSDKLVFVRECANESEGCGWLFIDMSKSHSRKWCSMSSCGNRNKVRSYYEREKSPM